MNTFYNIHKLTDHLFRHESGKMVSVLTRIFGTQNLETAEDVVQQTFMDAMGTWKLKGIPDNPSAWLFRVAKNKAIDIIRKNKHSVQYDFNESERKLLASEYTLTTTMEYLWKDELVKDNMLRMMFTCCHPGISPENQVTLVLKTLCGFSTAEIAKAFLTSDDTVSKRLYRTKEFFRDNRIQFDIPSVYELKSRTNAVLNSIYLLFNEGYNSTHSQEVIREDLIIEAMMLCNLLIENPDTQMPEVFAMMALMCFHSARNKSRLSTEGEIILLPYQDRSQWNYDLIAEGNEFMNKAIPREGDRNEISAYHLEAAIAFEHCIAQSFEATNWKKILELYEWLCRIAPSPVSELNKTVALMQVHGAAKALESIEKIPEKKKLTSFYLYHSLLGEIHSRLNDSAKAKKALETAVKLTQSESEKKVLREKIAALEG